MTTALITHLDCLEHVVPQGAPERTARLSRVLERLDGKDLQRLDAPIAEDAEIERVHAPGYAQWIREQIPTEGLVALDGDTYLSPGSENAIWRGVGGAILGVTSVFDGSAVNAFVATRPPGHHAETALPMGFCMFGNVAIAAQYALDELGLDRVAIVDFDVHHGNGTQALLAEEPRALVVSSHQSPLWPGTGAPHERGPKGNWLNVTFPPGSGGAVMRDAYLNTIFPALRAHGPEMIIVSAGFDAYQDDPLAQLNWSVEDFRWLGVELTQLASELCDRKLVSVLEGGYDLDGLGLSVEAYVDELIKAGQ